MGQIQQSVNSALQTAAIAAAVGSGYNQLKENVKSSSEVLSFREGIAKETMTSINELINEETGIENAYEYREGVQGPQIVTAREKDLGPELMGKIEAKVKLGQKQIAKKINKEASKKILQSLTKQIGGE